MPDIKEAEAVVDPLKDFEKRSKAWLENSPVCTKILDPDFNLLYMSKAGVSALKIDDIISCYGKPFPLEFYPEVFKESIYEKLHTQHTTFIK